MVFGPHKLCSTRSLLACGYKACIYTVRSVRRYPPPAPTPAPRFTVVIVLRLGRGPPSTGPGTDIRRRPRPLFVALVRTSLRSVGRCPIRAQGHGSAAIHVGGRASGSTSRSLSSPVAPSFLPCLVVSNKSTRCRACMRRVRGVRGEREEMEEDGRNRSAEKGGIEFFPDVFPSGPRVPCPSKLAASYTVLPAIVLYVVYVVCVYTYPGRYYAIVPCLRPCL